MDWKQKTIKRFSAGADADKWANIYLDSGVDVESVSFKRRRDYTVDYVLNNIEQGSAILDVGCGAGPVLNVLKDCDYHLVGIDFSADMLVRARQVIGEDKEILLARGEVEKIPAPDNDKDCVVCLGVISYATSIKDALVEIERVLKPGGKAIISYRNFYNPVLMDPIKALWYLLCTPYRWVKGDSGEKEIGRSIKPAEVAEALAQTNLTLLAEHQLSFGKIRLAGKVISDGKLAVKMDRFWTGLFKIIPIAPLYKLLTDVHLFVVEKK